MKTPILLIACAATLLASGCATTRISVSTPSGVKVSASFPKNMDARDLKVVFDPVHQLYKFEASSLKTDAAVVVREKNVGLASVTNAVSDVAKTAAPLILP